MTKNEGTLPGEDLVTKGLQDLHKEISSVEALLVLVGAPRLTRLGVVIHFPKKIPDFPEHDLYRMLEAENSKNVHSRYNALIRRLVSFERIMEQRR